MLSSERLVIYLPEFALLENGRVCLCDFKAHALLCTRRDHFLKKTTLAQMPVCGTDERNTGDTQGNPRPARACSQSPPQVLTAATQEARLGPGVEETLFSLLLPPTSHSPIKVTPFGLACH